MIKNRKESAHVTCINVGFYKTEEVRQVCQSVNADFL